MTPDQLAVFAHAPWTKTMVDFIPAAFPGANGQIAVVHLSGAPGSSQDLFAIDPTGQNRTPLTSTPEDDAFPSYSADGERIVFSRGPPQTTTIP